MSATGASQTKPGIWRTDWFVVVEGKKLRASVDWVVWRTGQEVVFAGSNLRLESCFLRGFSIWKF